MAGEVNATNVVLQDGVGAIVGQMEFTATYDGAPIDITNKANSGWRTLLADEGASKGVTITGTLVYNSDAQYRAMRAAVFAHTIGTYTLTFTSDATTDESWSGNFMPTALSDSLPVDDKITTSITFVSSGVITITPAA